MNPGRTAPSANATRSVPGTPSREKPVASLVRFLPPAHRPPDADVRVGCNGEVTAVFRAPNGKPRRPGIDLATMRDTLAFIQRDLQRLRGMEKAVLALGTALREVDHANVQPLGLTGDPKLLSRLFPRRR